MEEVTETHVLSTTDYIQGRLRWLQQEQQRLAAEQLRNAGAITELENQLQLMQAKPVEPVANRAARRRTKAG